MTRAVAAARLYIVNKWMLIWIPLIVIAAMFAITIVLQLVLNASGAGGKVAFNGAFQAVFWCLMAVAIAASTQMFPFAFAMSLTRRDFIFGTLIAALAVAVAYGLIYGILAWIETATGGYGLGAHGFDLMGFVGGSIWETTWFYGAIILFFFNAGLAGSMLWKRFNGKGLVVTGLIVILAVTGLGAWAGITNSWMRVFAWFGQQTPASIGLNVAGLAVLLAGASYLLIRHAEP